MSVKILKLLSGEEIIGEVTVEGEYYKVKDVAQILLGQAQDPTKAFSVHLVPFLPVQSSKEKEILVPSTSVICIYTPQDDLVDKHRLICGSGLVIPKLNLKNV